MRMIDLSVNANVNMRRHDDRLLEEATKKIYSSLPDNFNNLSDEESEALIEQAIEDFKKEYRSRGIGVIDAVLEDDEEAEDFSEAKLTSKKESQKSKKSRARP